MITRAQRLDFGRQPVEVRRAVDERLHPVSVAPGGQPGGGITAFRRREEPFGPIRHALWDARLKAKIRNPARPLCQDPGMPAVRRLLAVMCALAMLAGCAPGALPTETPASTTDTTTADAVMRIVRDTMAQAHLKAVIVRVTVDGKEVITQAVGESMTGVPATTDMHFRNGAVAISYVSTLLLKLVDEKKVSLDDKLSKWLPDVPHADHVTLGQLAQMTSGYVDYVIGNTAMNDALYADPFRRWTVRRHPRATPSHKPLLYEPGTNWNYAHTNYVMLGLALEKATGQ